MTQIECSTYMMDPGWLSGWQLGAMWGGWMLSDVWVKKYGFYVAVEMYERGDQINKGGKP